MPIWVNDAGVARQIREIWVNDAGVARRIQQIWVNDAGTPRLVYEGDVIEIGLTTASDSVLSPETGIAIYTLGNNGIITATELSGPDSTDPWITPQINMSGYEARATLLSGTLSSGTTGAWQNLGVTREWSREASPGTGLHTTSFTLEIRRASDATVLASETITLQAISEV